MRADLQHWRDNWFWGLAASGVVVLIGVACEYAEVRHEFIEWLPTNLWHRTFFPKYFEAKGNQTWVPFWAAVGLVVIVAGLAGEIICEVFVFNADNQISIFEGHMLDEARKETAVALERAAFANKRTAGLELQTAELTASNLRLEQAIAPRRLTTKQVQELGSLTQFSGKTIEVKSYANDAEGFLFGSQLVNALSKHILIADNRFTMQAGTQVFLGVLIEGGDNPLVAKLHAILAENGLDQATTISRGSSGVSVSTSFGRVGRGPTVAEITIGLKPVR